MEVRIGRYVVDVIARDVEGEATDFNRKDAMRVLSALCSMCFDAKRYNEAEGFTGTARRCGETANSIYDALDKAGYFD